MSAATRRTFLKSLGAGTAGLAASAALARQEDHGAAMTRKTRRPNLIYVFADQLRRQSCGYAGDPRATTPTIDRLAAQGVSFDNAVSATPVCSAHRASLFTGTHTTTHGMVINELRLSPDRECFGHALTRGGYRTGYVGKWHLWANELGNHYADRNGFVPPGPYRLGFDGTWAAYNFHHVYHNAFYYRDEPTKIPYGDPSVFEPDGQTDLAIDFVRKAAPRPEPFALFLSYGTPHDPWGWNNAPKEFAERFRGVAFPKPPNYSATQDPYADSWGTMGTRYLADLQQSMRVYYAMTANLDWNLGRLLAALETTGAAADTLVVFTSDHGEMFAAHGRRAKNIFYEEAARVPFLARWPKAIRPGTAADACLCTPDIMPTLLSLMGLPVPKAVEGMDLSHCALGTPGPEPEAALLQNTGACAAWADGYEWRALRSKRHTYAIYRRDRSELLFDNQADPYQTRNLARDPRHAGLLAHFRRILQARTAELKDTFPASTWYRDHWTRDRNILRGAKGGSHDLEALAKIIDKHFPVATGLQLHLTFDERANARKARDRSDAKRTLPFHGTRSVAGRSGKARSFDGAGDYLDLPADKAPNPANTPVTVSAWIKPAKPNGVVLAHGGSSLGYALHLRDGRLAFSVRLSRRLVTATAPDTLAAAARAAGADGWVHVAGQLAAGGALAVFVNGKAVARGKAPRLLPARPQDGLQVGTDLLSHVGAYRTQDFYGGLIDELKLSFGPVAEKEIAAEAAQSGA